MKSIIKFWDKFTDDEELIKFKLLGVTILMVFGLYCEKGCKC